jgi:hypothetical protein
VLLGVFVVSTPLLAQAPSDQQPAGPVIKNIQIEGASVYTADEIATRHGLMADSPLSRPIEEIASDIRRQYEKDGFTLASVDASLDEGSGTLTIRINEGRFDAIDVSGVRENIRRRVLDELALTPGEIFNAEQANRALDEALVFAQGAIARAQPTFTIVPDAGRRVLQVALLARDHQTGAFVGTQGREDWYSPVDALNAALGFQGTVFDTNRFNHAYWSGYVTYKFAPDRAGYSLGIERPFFRDSLLQAGADIHDLTASDDQWRLGDAEQSLVALTFRNTFRDYYRRKGYQLHAAIQPFNEHELLVAWRDDSHGALINETNYGFFRDSQPFRANATAHAGDIRSLIFGYTYDSRGLGRRPAERYRRHLLDNLFADSSDRDHGVRLDWRAEAAPRSFDQNFDFVRHIGTARAWWHPTPGRIVSGRLIAGTSTGVLPEQRVFALGGIGTVRGYRFKEAAGDGMVLLNGELRQRFGRSTSAGLAFVDVGRVFQPRPGSSDAWMRGVGVGLEFGGGSRIELGWRLDDIPQSLQILFRLKPTF